MFVTPVLCNPIDWSTIDYTLMHQCSFNFNGSIHFFSNTYRICNEFKFPIGGIVPLIWLKDKSLYRIIYQYSFIWNIEIISYQIHTGIAMKSSFQLNPVLCHPIDWSTIVYTLMHQYSFNFNGPIHFFSNTYRYCKKAKFPIDDGIGPFNWFE